MSAAAMASLQRELYAGEEEEQYATPPRVPPPGETIDDSSETSDGAVPADPVSGQVAGQMTPTPTPGGGVGAICTPDTSSSGTLGSTPVDPDNADQPASRRELLRLRRYLKETRSGLVEEVTQREELDDKLGFRIQTLSRCMDHNHAEVLELIKELRQDLQTGLEASKKSARDEAEALLMPVRDQAADIQANMYMMADNAQRATELAFQNCMDQLHAAKAQDSSDWSEWCLLDNEQFQELQLRVEALELGGSPSAPPGPRPVFSNEQFEDLIGRIRDPPDSETAPKRLRTGGGHLHDMSQKSVVESTRREHYLPS